VRMSVVNHSDNFPIFKKIINTDVFIDSTATYCILESRIRDEIRESDQPVTLTGWRVKYTLR